MSSGRGWKCESHPLPSFHSTNTNTQQSINTHMASASLSIPIAFWSQSTPTATISATLACEGYVVAGLEEGLIWVFKATCGSTDAGPPKDIVSVTSQTLLHLIDCRLLLSIPG